MGCLRNDYFIQFGLEKGVIYLVIVVIVNVLWDLWVKMENKVKLYNYKLVNILV